MNVDVDPDPVPRPISAKLRAIQRWGPQRSNSAVSSGLSFEEAVRIEQEAHAQDFIRKQRADERKRRLGLPIKGEQLTNEAMEARMWAYMNHKLTDSDLEDDDDDDDDDDDPSTWFVDEEDDGIKGQPIVLPDIDDTQSVIRIDELRALGYGTFYEPRED